MSGGLKGWVRTSITSEKEGTTAVPVLSAKYQAKSISSGNIEPRAILVKSQSCQGLLRFIEALFRAELQLSQGLTGRLKL